MRFSSNFVHKGRSIMKRLFILISLCLSVALGNLVADTKVEEAKKLYNEGLKFYLKRDFRQASDLWNKALILDNNNEKVKEQLDKAQAKYYESLQLFYQGVDEFKKGNYENAEKSFKDSLMINPLDEKTKYYLRLCTVPMVNITMAAPIITANKVFELSAEVDKSETLPNWIEKWNLDFFDKKTKVKSFSGTGDPSAKLPVDLRDVMEEIKTLDKISYAMTYTSLYGRSVTSATGSVNMDNIGPEISVASPSNFSPDNLNGQSNTLKITLDVKDRSGVTNVNLEIYSEAKDKLLASFPVKGQKQFVWDAMTADGTKIAGGTTIHYAVRAFDTLMNESQSGFKKVDTTIILQKREDNTVAMNLPNIEFAFGKADLLPSSYSILNRVYAILEKYPESKFAVEGHTDSIGSKERNLALSKLRAESVAKYLMTKFNIPADRIIVKGYGDARPKFPNDTEENRKKNRRVEIAIMN